MLWLTRPTDDSAQLAEKLKDASIETLVAPVMRIEPQEVTPGEKPDGIIVTSRHAIHAIPADWKDVTVYAVGGATAEAAKKAGSTNVRDGGGDALLLAAFIAPRARPGNRLLYLRGEEVRIDLARLLASKDITVDSAIAYTATPVPLSATLLNAWKNNAISAVVFFSAKSAEVARTQLAQAGLSSAGVDAYCLSLPIADAAGADWRNVKVAASPTLEAMITLITT